MSYAKISNLYRNQDILLFRECYALEKVHGTSAHISWDSAEKTMHYFSGGAPIESFKALFKSNKLGSTILSEQELIEQFQTHEYQDIIIYGEAYGGKMQGMSATYGKELQFIVFDIKIRGTWLSVPDMFEVATRAGLEVVPWEKTSTDLSTLDSLRDRPSEVATRRGCGSDKKREGIVLRPLIELFKGTGERIIAKHRIQEMQERANPPEVTDPTKLKILEEANQIAQEWVVENRLSHVLDKLSPDVSLSDTRLVIDAMIQDILIEASGEIIDSPEARKAISKRTAQMFKNRCINRVKTPFGET